MLLRRRLSKHNTQLLQTGLRAEVDKQMEQMNRFCTNAKENERASVRARAKAKAKEY